MISWRTVLVLPVAAAILLVVGTPAHAGTILIDVGWTGYQTTEEAPDRKWNNVTFDDPGADPRTTGTGYFLTDMIDSTGAPTPVAFNLLDDFNGVNNLGPTGIDFGLDYPDSAKRDSFFLDDNQSAQFRIEGLMAGELYDFTIFGLRTASNNRGTQITLTGATVSDPNSFVAGGATPYVTFTDIEADASGYITVDALQTTDRFGYIGVVQIEGTFVSDLDVDAADYIALKTRMGQATSAGATEGDFDDDGDVDWDDLQILQDAFREQNDANANPVPEPATLLIMLAAGLPVMLKRRRSRS